jgi:hypothetical protein
MDREEIARACLDQAEWAVKLGSPMYDRLLRRMADDVRRGGPCLAVLEPLMPASRMLAPLLVLAALHRMVLDGQLPDAARYYPSAGGQVDVDGLWPQVIDALPHISPPACVQTNEVERSRALLPGFVDVATRTGLPLRLLEIGASAGLNLRWDHFPFLAVPAAIRIAERRGCDLNPIDPTLAGSRGALLCFVWPDQTDRLRLLADAIDIARRVPAPVDRSDAVDWLHIHLAEPRPGVATIVYHSIVMPYLTEANREALRRVIEDAGSGATTDAPVAWLAMEPGNDQADVHLTLWPGGERRLIARSDFHGRAVRIL